MTKKPDPPTILVSVSPQLSPDYIMGHCAPLSQERVQNYFDGKLSCQELVLFAQDAIEVGAVWADKGIMALAQHCVAMGLCYENGRLLQ